MVAGTITGREIDFPDSPVNGDEFQAPNKFVYEWKDDNRWKNIHRPLYVPDYIWPDISNPDDPFGTGDPGGNPDPNPGDPGGPDPNGGGGDDWTLEVIDLPVNNGESTIFYDIVMRTNEDLYLPAGGLAVERTANFPSDNFIGDERCEIPYMCVKRIDDTVNTPNVFAQAGPDLIQPFDVSSVNPGDKWFTNYQTVSPEFNSSWPVTWINVREMLSEKGYDNRDKVSFRIRASATYIGGSFPSYWCYLSAVGYLENATALDVGVNSTINWYAEGLNSWSDGKLDRVSPFQTMTFDTEWLALEGRLGGGFEIGDITLEVYDPFTSGERTNDPVGFASNPEHTQSLITFNGPSGPIMRSMKHGDPGRLSNTFFDQIEYGDTGYLDVSSGASDDMEWGCLWMREDNNMYMTATLDSPTVVQARHLYTTGDLSSHSVFINGVYDFKDYSSKSPSLGFDVSNICMSPDGDKLFAMKPDGDIRCYDLSTPWDLSTIDQFTYDELNMDPDWNATAFDITQDGYVIVMVKAGKVKQLIMETPWDLTTTVDSGFERDFLLDNPVDICVSADGKSIMVLDVPADLTLAYSIYNYTRNI